MGKIVQAVCFYISTFVLESHILYSHRIFLMISHGTNFIKGGMFARCCSITLTTTPLGSFCPYVGKTNFFIMKHTHVRIVGLI